jgi:hypothetical protein
VCLLWSIWAYETVHLAWWQVECDQKTIASLSYPRSPSTRCHCGTISMRKSIHKGQKQHPPHTWWWYIEWECDSTWRWVMRNWNVNINGLVSHVFINMKWMYWLKITVFEGITMYNDTDRLIKRDLSCLGVDSGQNVCETNPLILTFWITCLTHSTFDQVSCWWQLWVIYSCLQWPLKIMFMKLIR